MGEKVNYLVTFRCDAETRRKLEALCELEDRPASYLVRRIVTEGLVAYSERGALGSRQASRSAPKATPPVQPGSQPPPRGTCR